LDSQLLRADPDTLAPGGALSALALGRGEAVYEVRCVACHGDRGQGDSARGIPALDDGDWLYGTGSVSDIEQIVTYGIRSFNAKTWNLAIMPAYATPHPSARDAKIPSLAPGDIRDLVEFLFARQGRSADAASAARGAALYAGVAGCYDCHAADAKGDSAIGAPNLTDPITLYGDGSREALAMSIAYGRHGVCPAWAARLSHVEIREVAVFAHSLSHPHRSAPGIP